MVSASYHRDIQAIRMFRTGDEAFIAALVVHSKPHHAVAGDVIYGMGDVADEISFVTRGAIRITVPNSGVPGNNEKSKESLLGYITAGEYFGDFEYHLICPRVATYRAVQNSHMLSIDFIRFKEAIESNHEAGAKLLQEFESRYEAFQKLLRRQVPTFNSKSSVNKGNQRSSEVETKFKENKEGNDFKENVFGQKNRSSESNVMKGFLSNRSSERIPHRNSEKEIIADNDYTIRDSLWTDGELLSIINHPSLEQNPQTRARRASDDICYNMIKEDETLGAQGGQVLVEDTIESLGKLWILHPKGTKKLVWDAIIGLFVIFSVITIPAQMAFTSFKAAADLDIIHYVIDAFFFIDIFVNFRTAYFSALNDAYIIIPKYIAWNYTMTWFIFDVMAVIPLIAEIVYRAMLSNNETISTNGLLGIQLIKFAKLFRLFDFSKWFSRVYSICGYKRGIDPKVFSLGTMILQVRTRFRLFIYFHL
jgi:CRP-like cAMP-binding protein